MKSPARFWHGLAVAMLVCTACHAERFDLDSPSLRDGGQLTEAQVFNGFGCSGKNRSPALHWSGQPAETRSFAVTVYDPDAPTGSGWWHWVVYDIPATVTELPEGGLPVAAKQGRTDFGPPGFGGACPPAGDKPHRYIFTVHALKVDKLTVPDDASPAMVSFMINANRLASASLTARYGRGSNGKGSTP